MRLCFSSQHYERSSLCEAYLSQVRFFAGLAKEPLKNSPSGVQRE